MREWAFLGWTALADMAKYLRRGSLWEVLERLHQARTHIWQLWAVAQGATYPAFGLTSVLDSPTANALPDIETTAARLDYGELHRAALSCAALLDRTARLAAAVVAAELPLATAAFVCRQLEALPDRQ